MIIVDYSAKKVLQGKLWQYNYGQVLRIQGGNLQKAQEIQFALEETGGESVPRIGITRDGVTDVVIPDTMLENNDSEVDYPVYVFIYNRDETSGETVDKFVLNVLSRSKPEHTGGSDDGDAFGKVIEEVNNSAERAETAEKQAAQHAEQTKTDAIKTSEDRTAIAEMVETVSGIGEQVEAVKGYADQAQTAATNALQSERASNEAKEAALQAQTNAETAEGKAEQHAIEVAGDKAEVERLATQVRQDKSSVEQTVQGFENTVQQAEQSINTAKTQAVETVNATKSNAIKAVQTEGTKQVKAVADKGQEVINSIPEDFTTQMATKLDKQQGTENAGKALIVDEDGNVIVGEPAIQIEVDKTLTQEGQAADAKATGDKILQFTIKNTASGESIVLTDSAEEKLLDFTMQGKTEQASTTGKNLFDVNGIDATRHILGDLSGFSDVDVKSFNLSNLIPVKEGESIVKSGTTGSSVVGFLGEDKSFLKGISLTDGKPVAVPVGAFYFCCNIAVANLKNKIQIEKGNSATEYEEYTGGKPSPSVEYPQEITNAGDDGSVGIKVTGKNLFDISKLKIEHDEEKIIIKQTNVYLKLAENFEDNTRYTVSFESYKNNGSSNHVLFEYVYTDGSRSEWYANSIPVKGFASSANKTIDYLWIRNPWKAYAEITKIQVEKGTERTVYEPYKNPQVIAIPLDRPFTKWDRLEKRDGVYGIVCKSKEVVFDGSGDEIWRNQTDLIGNTQFYITLDDSSIKNTPDFIDNFYCDKFTKTSKTGDIAIGEVRYGILKYTFAPVFKPKDEVNTLSLWRNLLKENTIKVTYITDAEEFVPLPEETQIALNALHTNYPTTVITNSEDCEMEVTYVCDTKTYIDNKISENVASVISKYQTNVANLLSLMPLETQATMIANDTNNILESEVTQ